jgi:hypothetical protein
MSKEEKEQEKKDKADQQKADTAFNDLLKRARERGALLTEPLNKETWRHYS